VRIAHRIVTMVNAQQMLIVKEDNVAQLGDTAKFIRTHPVQNARPMTSVHPQSLIVLTTFAKNAEAIIIVISLTNIALPVTIHATPFQVTRTRQTPLLLLDGKTWVLLIPSKMQSKDVTRIQDVMLSTTGGVMVMMDMIFMKGQHDIRIIPTILAHGPRTNKPLFYEETS